MTSTYSWTVLVLLSLNSIVSAQTCKWLSRNQGEWSKQILRSFHQMVPANINGPICQGKTQLLHNFDDSLFKITQVESAAIAVREVGNQTIQFYRTNHSNPDYHKPAWERLQELLHHQQQHLSDCIPEGAENQLFIEGISERFNTLQRILEEQGYDACAWRTVNAQIGRILLLASRLSALMRKQNN